MGATDLESHRNHTMTIRIHNNVDTARKLHKDCVPTVVIDRILGKELQSVASNDFSATVQVEWLGIVHDWVIQREHYDILTEQ